MRRRVLTTTKILAVAVAILPGCSKPEAKPEPIAIASSVAVIEVSQAPKVDAAAPDPKLVALAGELGTMEKKEALDHISHFRPLCDDQGYPLVGNLPTKATLTPSQLCAEVRKQKTP